MHKKFHTIQLNDETISPIPTLENVSQTNSSKKSVQQKPMNIGSLKLTEGVFTLKDFHQT